MNIWNCQKHFFYKNFFNGTSYKVLQERQLIPNSNTNMHLKEEIPFQ